MSIHSIPRNVPVHWNRDTGRWIVHLPPSYPRSSLSKLREYVINAQKQRRFDLPPGDLRDDLDRSIIALQDGKIEFYTGTYNNRTVLFEASTRDNPTKSFHINSGDGI